jgi:excisionase family DNA binding protein
VEGLVLAAHHYVECKNLDSDLPVYAGLPRPKCGERIHNQFLGPDPYETLCDELRKIPENLSNDERKDRVRQLCQERLKAPVDPVSEYYSLGDVDSLLDFWDRRKDWIARRYLDLKDDWGESLLAPVSVFHVPFMVPSLDESECPADRQDPESLMGRLLDLLDKQEKLKSDEKWLTSEDVVDRFGIIKRTLRRWMKEGKLKAYYPYPSSRSVRFKKSEVDALYKNGSPCRETVTQSTT